MLTECWLTLQAVSEFYAVVTRKTVMPAGDAARLAGHWLDVFPCIAASADAVRTALASAMGKRASHWDALLVATAAEIGCKAILTEDLADGAMLHGVRVLNPFTDTPSARVVARLLSEH